MISAPLELTCRNGLLVLILTPLTSHIVPDCGDIPSNKQAGYSDDRQITGHVSLGR